MRRLAFRIGFSVAALAVTLAAAGRVEAGAVTYEISGSFGRDLIGNTGLAGGSFSGTFTTSGLPVAPGNTATFAAYNIDVYDSHHHLVVDLKSSDLNTSEITGLNFGSKKTELVFNRLALHNPNVFGMDLYFPKSFNGNGHLVPFNLFDLQSSRFQTASLFGHTGVGTIASGHAYALPEPSSLALGLIGALGSLGCAWRRRAAAA